MLKQIGEAVEKGEPIARSKGIFGAFKTEVPSDATGTIEQVSSVTGQVMVRGAAIPVQVRAYLSGKVVEVLPKEGCIIENDVMFVQGIFGIGGETEGVIHVACSSHEETLEADAITPEMKGAVVLGGARMTAAALRKAIEVGAAAVVRRLVACPTLPPCASDGRIAWNSGNCSGSADGLLQIAFIRSAITDAKSVPTFLENSTRSALSYAASSADFPRPT